ncbi:MAG: NADPH:quinone oxidoreductase family protein [Pseudomonadales bacterium]|jgi:NADPH2:quinone reductase|nr:NADPH:quinone oxidoreductase family protein [Pseudomonadales bacterium]
MRAVVGAELGGPERYELTEAPRRAPDAGEVEIAISVAGMGYVDALIAAGGYQVKPPTPYVPSLEFSGRIERLGDGVTGFEVGQRVAAAAFGGGLAEYAVVPAAVVAPIPDALEAGAAAGFTTNYMTAWHALVDRAGLRAGETVLVLGAAGGVGVAAVQVARLAGARVIAGASTEAKRGWALAQGAHATIDYTDPEWRKALKGLTDGRGVDVVFDPVGGDLLEPAFRSLAWRGRHLVIGFTGGPIPALSVNLALLKGAALMGVDLRQFQSVHEADAALAMRGLLFDAVGRGDLRPPVGARYAFEDFRAAMAQALSRDGLGKTVVEIAAEDDDG